jgi:large subunit ribosomal protein L19
MANNLNIKGITIHIGDTVDVHYRLIEKEKVAGKAKREVKEEIKERIQIYSGVVIAIKGSSSTRTFTVRKIGVDSIGIERIFLAFSPWIQKITVQKRGDVRRAKLYYLRGKIGKEALKIKELKTIKDVSKKPKTAQRKPSRKPSRKVPAKK